MEPNFVYVCSDQGKSALWSHLVSYLEVEECKSSGKPIDPNFLTPGKYIYNQIFMKIITLFKNYLVSDKL